MLQNRVDPQGTLIQTAARGAWTGTRGLLHNDQQQVVRAYKLKAWLTCLLEFKGRKRKVMSPGRYTELFFLDEATAFSAGHRPCAECRRNDFTRFKHAWLTGNGEYGFNEKTRIHEIDNILHNERIDALGIKVTYEQLIDDLPTGVFIVWNEKPHLIKDESLYPWSPFGYEQAIPKPKNEYATVLTPRSIVNAFRAGYAVKDI